MQLSKDAFEKQPQEIKQKSLEVNLKTRWESIRKTDIGKLEED